MQHCLMRFVSGEKNFFGILRYFFHVLYLANVIDYAFNLFHDVQLKVY